MRRKIKATSENRKVEWLRNDLLNNNSLPFIFFTRHPSKPAFTLAEVLITIAVIGVVAAITLPSIIQKYKEKVLLHQFEQAVSIYSQGFMRMANDADGLQNLKGGPWNDMRTVSGDLFKKYFQLNKVCTGFNKYQQCIPWTYYYTDKKSVFNPETRNGIMCSGYTFAAGELRNGNTFCLGYTGGDFWNLAIDVNGTKGPNAIGHDYFLLRLFYNGKLESVPANEYRYCGRGRNDGFGCSRWIMQNHNLDYLHDKNKGY